MAKWWRLELGTRTDEVEPGLQARVADPLWLLARQWQVGEFRGEDASTPIHARVELESTHVQSVRREPGGDDSGPVHPIDSPEGLEAMVEGEAAWDGAGQFRVAADAGLHFLRLLSAHGVGALRAEVRAAYPLATPDSDSELPAHALRQIALLARRAPNGLRLRDDVEAGGLVLPRALSLTEQAGLRAASTQFLNWTAAWIAVPPRGETAWAPPVMEYGLSVAAPGPTETVLRARAYTGGRLDWDDFEIDRDTAHGTSGPSYATTLLGAAPAPVRYRGMPASRWWEFEDAQVHFGGLEASTADQTRLVVAEFATVYGDDWFVVPVAVSGLVRVVSLDVRDSFGDEIPIPSTATIDGPDRVWRFFELTGDDGPESGKSPCLFIPAATPHALEGDDLERVVMIRDEDANLAWAVEERIEGPHGGPIDRVTAWRSGMTDNPDAAPPTLDGWSWHLAPTIPRHWIPLVPERQDDEQIQLRRGRVLIGVDESGDAISEGAHGMVLEPEDVLRVHEEAVPVAGVSITRSWQLARDRDGRVHLWLGRRKAIGRPRSGQGLRFDRIEKDRV